MEIEHILEQLQEEETDVLLNLLENAYDTMNTNQRREVFGSFAKCLPSRKMDGETLLQEVELFEKASLAGRYYASFMIDSKNFMDVPEETEEWFERLGDLLANTSLLSEQEEHDWAVACFQILYKLINKMERGEEIVFADELGSWMIPGEEKDYIAAYLKSLGATSSPEGFSEEIIPLLKRDSYNSFTQEVYPSALKLASAEQINHLKAEVKRQKIRTSSSRSRRDR